jgi:hypothetical protein
MLPEIFAYSTPKPEPVVSNAIRKLYKLIKEIDGFEELPLFCRNDVVYLRRWMGKYHPNENKKIILIISYLMRRANEIFPSEYQTEATRDDSGTSAVPTE